MGDGKNGANSGWRGAASRAFTAALMLAATALPAGAQAPPGAGGGRGAPAGPSPVGVMTLSMEAVPYTQTLPGRAVAFQDADIRPRVSGVVSAIPYEPGRPVKAGDVLFVVDDESFAASLQAADAALAQSEAAVSAAKAALNRAQSLKNVGATVASIETAQVALAQAEAGRSAARAQQKLAQIDLEQTRLRSPIDGVAGLPAVTVGAVVTANQATALARVQRLDPIYVDVQQSSAAMLRNRERFRDGSVLRGQPIDVRLTLETGEIYAGTGEMVTPPASVSTTTGTSQFRFRFDNPERLILPGQFLRVGVTLGETQALLVPQRATNRAADGTLTAFVVREGKARQVTLTEAGTARNAWVVTQGVEPGEQVIVDGLRGLRDGAEVAPVAVTITPDGVVEEVAPPGGAASPPEQAGAAGPTGSRPAAGN